MKRIQKNCSLWEGIFSLYTAVVLYFTFFTTLKYIIMLPVIIVCCWKAIRLIEDYCIENFKYTNSESDTVSVKVCLIWFMIILLGQILYWGAYYPGGFNLDAYGQWDQVHGLIHLNNWHPVFTTAIYWVLTRINDSLAFCIGIQIIVFSATIAMLLRELSKIISNQIILWIGVFFISLNPAIGMTNICLIKDVPFCIILCWTFIYYMRIESSCGELLRSISHCCILSIVVLMLMLVRHNAVFFTLPFFLSLFVLFKNNRKQIIAIAVSCFSLLLIIEGPLFSRLSIEQHSNVVGESVGIPMAAMANAFINNPEECPDDVREFLLSIADEKEWKQHYYAGEWDSCKWEFGGIELLKDESLNHIIRMFTETSRACPNEVYYSIRENTRVIWQIYGDIYWQTWVYIEGNDYHIIEAYNPLCRKIADVLLEISSTYFGALFSWEIGLVMLIMYFCMAMLHRKGKLQKSGFIVSMLCYNMLTMCMLCGPSFRYFYANIVLVLPILGYVISDSNKKGENYAGNSR